MKYDPIKKSLGIVFNKTPGLRKLFYCLLDLLLLRTWYIKREIKSLKDEKKQRLKVLDAGSGFGQYTYFLYRWSSLWEIYGIDIKEEQVRDCTDFFSSIDPGKRVHFFVRDLTEYIEPDTYDLVLCVDVMEHIPEDEKVFSNYYHSLKPGGIVLLSTPSDQGGSDVHDHEEESFIDEHVRDGYNINDIREKLSRAGFSRSETYYSYGRPGQAAWKLSMKVPVTLLNISKLFFIALPFYYIVVYPFAFILNRIDVLTKHHKGTGLIVKAWK